MPDNRRICFFCSVASFTTGMPISTSKLIRHFAAHPHYQAFAIFPENGEFPERLRAQGIAVAIIPFKRFKLLHPAALVAATVSLVPAIMRIRAFLRVNKIDIIHFSDFIDAPFYCAAYLSGIRCVAHLRMNIESSLLRTLYRIWAFFWTDRVICISESVAAHAGIAAGKKEIIYNPGPDTAVFNSSINHPFPTMYNRKMQRIVTIADFREVKGQEYFIELALRIERYFPGQAQFIVVGGAVEGHEAYYTRIMELARVSKLGNCFAVTGKVRHEEVPAYLAHAHVLVHLPKYQEGLGGVVLEAMIMGVPVVAFASGGVVECFTDKVSGFLVPQFDMDSATDRVARFIRNEDLRIKMGNAAREEVARKFSYERHFAEVGAVYDSVRSIS